MKDSAVSIKKEACLTLGTKAEIKSKSYNNFSYHYTTL